MTDETTPAAETTEAAEKKDPGKATITFDDFMKLDLRVATVREAILHPNADKLLALQVELADGEMRQILAGIRAAYDPETLVGKQIIIVANLAPRKMRGLESQGMLIAASNDDHSDLALLTLDKPMPAGASCG